MRKSNPWVVAAIAALLLLLAATSAFADKVGEPTAAKPETMQTAPTAQATQVAQVVKTSEQPKAQAAPKTENVPNAVDQSEPASDLSITLELNDEPRSQSQSVTNDKPGTVDDMIMGARTHMRKIALCFLGTPYRWGGTTPNGFDCSGFTRFVYNKLGVRLPRTAREQYKAGTPVKVGQLKPGDLIFFNILKGYVSHVGMYLGKNMFVHAANPRSGVRIDSLNKPYYRKYYVGARRFSLS